MNNSGNTHPITSPELWDKLRQIRWEWLTDLPTAVSDVMLEAADFVEAAMSQPQSPSASLSDALAECGCPPHCCCCGVGEPCCDCGMVRPSAACIGESCFCGEPAVKKVGEEILFDDPLPNRHNLTAYVCAIHYSQIMGPLGVKQVWLPEAMKPKEQSNEDDLLNDALDAADEAEFGQ